MRVLSFCATATLLFLIGKMSVAAAESATAASTKPASEAAVAKEAYICSISVDEKMQASKITMPLPFSSLIVPIEGRTKSNQPRNFGLSLAINAQKFSLALTDNDKAVQHGSYRARPALISTEIMLSTSMPKVKISAGDSGSDDPKIDVECE